MDANLKKRLPLGAGSHEVLGKVGLRSGGYNTKGAVQTVFETEKGKKMCTIHQLCETT